MGKVVSLEDLIHLVDGARKNHNIIALCHGVFDVVHPGHTAYFEEAKKHSDTLIVTVTPDRFVNRGPGRPIFGEQLRAKEVASKSIVDYVAINEYPTAIETIKRLKPDYYVKGPDYKDQQLDLTTMIGEEQKAIEEVGGELLITDTPLYSSSSLINQFLSPLPEETQQYLEKFREEHLAKDIIKELQGLHDLKVLIIGDVIIDEYVYCDVLGASPKDHMLTARYSGEERFAGGVLAVANHVASFCDNITLVSITSSPHDEVWTRSNVKRNVKHETFWNPHEPTPYKRRFVEPDSFRKLFEIAYLPQTTLGEGIELDICSYLGKHARKYDLVVVCDFGHGLMTQDIIGRVCNEARFLAVNAQTNSANRGFNPITKYHNIKYTSLDELEVRLAAADMFKSLQEVTSTLLQRDNPLIAVTRGRHGSSLFQQGEDVIETPVLSTRVVDAVGAGDAFLSVTSLLAARGASPSLIGFVGNVAGGLHAGVVGNKTSLDPVEVYKFITALLK
ncbi:hypothetical protein LCGC14_0738650 [marine sediment metagenome]|uniref:Cytidyltransferase-like domain-containing protein n=1 Tax=marine sediment metagenome TaxID=412755 RepID=A0A0F9Q7B8_9ZZZZ